MNHVLRILLQSFIRKGSVTFTTASGERFSCGDGTGPAVAARFMTPAAERAILFDPELKLGESYMDGTFVVEQGTIADALAIFLGQPDAGPRWVKPQALRRYLMRHLQQFNPRPRAR